MVTITHMTTRTTRIAVVCSPTLYAQRTVVITIAFARASSTAHTTMCIGAVTCARESQPMLGASSMVNNTDASKEARTSNEEFELEIILFPIFEPKAPWRADRASRKPGAEDQTSPQIRTRVIPVGARVLA